VKARTDEIFEMLKKQLVLAGFNFSSGTNLFLTGQGSNLNNIDQYCRNFFELNTTARKNENLEKNFSACMGGVKIISDGWETEAIPELKPKSIEKVGFLRKIFGNR